MKRWWLAIPIVFAVNLVWCQDTVDNIKNGTLDLSVPESPAFTVLGLTPQSITHPATPRALASSLLNGVDQNGNFQTGVAIDTAPYMLFHGNDVSLGDYQKSRMTRFLARTQFSFATTKGASDNDKSAKLAAGLSLAIFDKGDARQDPQFLAKLVKAAQGVQDSFPALPPGHTADDEVNRAKQIVDKVEAITKPIRKEYERTNWNRSSWIIAGAPSWISTDGSTSHIAFNGAAVWSSIAYGFEGVPALKRNAQIIFHGRFHSAEEVPDPLNKGQFYKQQSEVFGGRFRYGTENTIGSFETVYIHTAPVGRPTDRYFRLTLGAEKKLTDNVWFHFGVGGESGQKNGQNKLFVLGTFKWGAGPKS